MPSPHFPNAFTTQPLTGETSRPERADLFRQQYLGNDIMRVPEATAYLPSHHILLSIMAAECVTIEEGQVPGLEVQRTSWLTFPLCRPGRLQRTAVL